MLPKDIYHLPLLKIKDRSCYLRKHLHCNNIIGLYCGLGNCIVNICCYSVCMHNQKCIVLLKIRLHSNTYLLHSNLGANISDMRFTFTCYKKTLFCMEIKTLLLRNMWFYILVFGQ